MEIIAIRLAVSLARTYRPNFMQHFSRVLAAAAVLVSSFSWLQADEPGMVVAGNTRFTVITPNLIRIEYAPDGKFVDAPSWFATQRATRDKDAQITAQNGKVEINTGVMHLFLDDSAKPVTQDNLHVDIKKGSGIVTWKPGMHSDQNLGGTITTLDMRQEAVNLGEGLLSRDGWYLLDDSHSALFVGDWIQSRPKNNGLDWYLFGYGDDYHAAFRSLTAAGGPVPLPRKYTMGIWYSRYWPYSADDYKTIVGEYEQHGFPLDNIVMDMDWHLNQKEINIPGVDGWTGYTWDTKLIPDPPGLLKWFHDQGLHVTLNDHPAEGMQRFEAAYPDFMRAMGKDPASGETLPFDAGDKHYLDTFFQFARHPHEKEGVDFWWLDWQQYRATHSLPDVTNLQVLNYYDFTDSARDGLRGQSFSRWAGWGDHRYPIQFSGDADTGWKMLAFEVPFTSTGGNVGAFYWSHDIGGHIGARNEESYTRWCQFGALSAVLRSHSSRRGDTDRRPWTYPDWAENSMRGSFRLRAELMPYIYTSAAQATQTSVPFLRPLYVDFPTVEDAYHNAQEYLFGDNLLVAPITEPGVGPNRVATQSVWFPEGAWYDYFTGERFTGPADAIAVDSIDTFPLYVRGGVPLPMQAYNHRPATVPLTDLVLRCYPGDDGKTGTSVLYEDDGVTDGYKHGESSSTALTYARHGDEITVTVAAPQGTFKGQVASRRCVIELPCTEKLTSCSDANAHTTYDDATQMNRIELPEASIQQGFHVVIHAAEIDPTQVRQRAMAEHLKEVLGKPYEEWLASKAPLPEGTETAFAAAQGYGLVTKNVHQYLLGPHTIVRYVHNHAEGPDAVTLTIGDATPQSFSLQSGDPVSGLSPYTNLPIELTSVSVALTAKSANGLILHTNAPIYADPKDDLALQAKAEASSGDASMAIDGTVGGYPINLGREWGTANEKEGAWIKLTWPQPIEANTICLYDRPNPLDDILAGTLEFDDGSKIETGELPSRAELPLKVVFPMKKFQWVKFTVTKVSVKTHATGLAEIVVLKASNPQDKSAAK